MGKKNKCGGGGGVIELYFEDTVVLRVTLSNKNSEDIEKRKVDSCDMLLYFILYVVCMFCVHIVLIYHKDLSVYVSRVCGVRYQQMVWKVCHCVNVFSCRCQLSVNQNMWLCRSQVSSFNIGGDQVCMWVIGFREKNNGSWSAWNGHFKSSWISFAFICGLSASFDGTSCTGSEL